MSEKIFGIGFTKTGITSLSRALEILGYRVYQNLVINTRRSLKISRPVTTEKILPHALAVVPRFDVVTDDPWPLLYREMDAAFPNSRFILTSRDLQNWITSMLRHFGDDSGDYRQWIYGAAWPRGNEDHYCEVYNSHNRAVRAYFAARPQDFLELDAEKGEGWEKLAPFLGKTAPPFAYPHENSAEERERELRRPGQRLMRVVRKYAKRGFVS
jgi:hypothetical protein